MPRQHQRRRTESDEQKPPNGKKQRKRPRTPSPSKQQQQQEQRPDPPPPAPAALVRLLKKDKKVLDYFRALQLNLAYDVEKWKTRSRAHQEELEELKKTIKEERQRENERRASVVRSSKDHQVSNDASQSDEGKDSFFDFECSSSSKDENDSGMEGNDCNRDDGNDNADIASSTNRKNRSPMLTGEATEQDLQTSTDTAAPRSFKFHFDSDDDESEEENNHGNSEQNAGAASFPRTIPENHKRNPVRGRNGKGEQQWRERRGDWDPEEAEIETQTSAKHDRFPRTKDETVVSNRIRVGWKLLRKAQNCLEEIGIVLAATVAIPENNHENNGNNNAGDENSSACERFQIKIGKSQEDVATEDLLGVHDCGDDDDDDDSSIATPRGSRNGDCTFSYVRISDNAVLGDILQRIKEWTKLKTTVAFPLVSKQGSSEKQTKARTSRKDEDVSEKGKESHVPPTKESTDDNRFHKGNNAKFHYQYAAFDASDLIPCFVPMHRNADSSNSSTNEHEDANGSPKKQHLEYHSPQSLSLAIPQHPAVKGTDLLLKALSWIDAFGPILDEVEVDGGLFLNLVRLEKEGKEDNDNDPVSPIGGGDDSVEISAYESAVRFVTGMKRRHLLVQNFVESLAGEICDAWPIQDRLNRVDNPPQHFNKEKNHFTGGNGITSRKLVIDSKNSLRLATIVDRCILARIVTAIYLHRSDPTSAITLLFRYLLSTGSSLQLEEEDFYPNHPPVQSLCVVEAILNTQFDGMNANSHPTKVAQGLPKNRTLLDYLVDNILLPDHTIDENNPFLMVESFHLSIAISATIFCIRTNHDDSRVSELALVEVGAYNRLKEQLDAAVSTRKRGPLAIGTIDTLKWSETLRPFYVEECRRFSKAFLDDLASAVQKEDDVKFGYYGNHELPSMTIVMAWLLPMTLVVEGDGHKLREIFSQWSEMFLSLRSGDCLFVVEACVRAMRQLEISSLKSYRTVISSPATNEVSTVVQSIVARLVESMTDWDSSTIVTEKNSAITPTTLHTLIGICYEVADGETALKLIQRWIVSSNEEKKAIPKQQLSSKRNDLSRPIDFWSAFPMVRVINLQRRQDRMASFMAQAMHAGLWVLRGVIPPDRWKMMEGKRKNNDLGETMANDKSPDLTSYIGTYAIDGSQGSPAEVEKMLMEWLDVGELKNGASKTELKSLVLPQWRPNDLRAFDIHASDDPNLMVSLSPSEKACALSHIATWKGIASASSDTCKFSYTGLARGDPIHNKNDDDPIPPCPVALVLEDDAVLVDRFQERLDQILRELPRDFHYCALGYARPKEAPLVDIPGCAHIKLPTMTWYLTGYLLSKSGARYLLDRLPVEGPVDAWIGRKMILTSNWENDYGYRLGVGDAPHIGSDSSRPTLTQKEIRLCVQFRAYCASIPLCDQKVRTAIATGASTKHRNNKPNQNWRLRDSDIVYSGNIGKAT